jgi:mRNA-degrading endonuclease RelE of RelBE toxin-antitoxin system
MTWKVEPDPKVEATLRKMWQKDSVRFGQVEKKLRELAENPEIGKPF